LFDGNGQVGTLRWTSQSLRFFALKLVEGVCSGS
jgi:hypothetical protein